MIKEINDLMPITFSLNWKIIFNNNIIKWNPAGNYELSYISIKNKVFVWQIDITVFGKKLFFIRNEYGQFLNVRYKGCENSYNNILNDSCSDSEQNYFIDFLKENYPDDLTELLFEGVL